VPAPDGTPAGAYYVNAGNVQYRGVEGQAAYAFDFGLSLFANGSSNTAKTVGGTELTKAPRWTDAFGGIYHHGQWESSLTFKQIGAQAIYQNTGATAITSVDGVTVNPGEWRYLKPIEQTNFEVGYNLDNYKVKMGVYNIADHRSINGLSGSGSASSLFSFETGRQVLFTLQGKF